MDHFYLRRTWTRSAAVLLMLSVPVMAGSSNHQVSASIAARATVINPVGFADTGTRNLSPADEGYAVNTAEIHVSLAGHLLVRLPADGSLLVQVELDGNPYSCEVLTPNTVDPYGGSDPYADTDYPLIAVPLGVSHQTFSVDGSCCVVTLITTEN
ncbi:MAG: hypothetical protein JSU65_12750 [Candidatus Zixiibacteriota bacterium]|nr:MAG: hypothetical protein JSU65_12750 [candidate division Zixibacteria bacterium]